eukprot:1918483-Alexandrium_andersonii.AAC.1
MAPEPMPSIRTFKPKPWQRRMDAQKGKGVKDGENDEKPKDEKAEAAMQLPRKCRPAEKPPLVLKAFEKMEGGNQQLSSQDQDMDGQDSKRARARELLEELGEHDLVQKLDPPKPKHDSVDPFQGIRETERYLEACRARAEASTDRLKYLREQVDQAEEVAAQRAAELKKAEDIK